MDDIPDTTASIPMYACPACRGKEGCDCDLCWGRGMVAHPGRVAKAMKDLALLHRRIARMAETGKVTNLPKIAELARVGVRIGTENGVVFSILHDEYTEGQPTPTHPAPKGGA